MSKSLCSFYGFHVMSFSSINQNNLIVVLFKGSIRTLDKILDLVFTFPLFPGFCLLHDSNICAFCKYHETLIYIQNTPNLSFPKETLVICISSNLTSLKVLVCEFLRFLSYPQKKKKFSPQKSFFRRHDSKANVVKTPAGDSQFQRHREPLETVSADFLVIFRVSPAQ